MIILGIDPGTTRIGYGVVESEGNRMQCLAYGIIGQAGLDKLENLKQTEKQLLELIKKYKPERAGLEKLFFTNNRTTAMAVSEMRGVLLLTLTKHDIPIHEFTPLQVKQYISAYGKADKTQVQRMVRMLLNIQNPIKPDDAADALAIAICCSSINMYE
ncbi:MAG TPA: crossover junction endodeoxyribonuclease RuvC [Candidatus Paceibacterota bacterium]|nr:crossover junction endodeoxyribonuclease RuvC [Candidatus Paceibacterota bacterium]